jgi:alginate O-acetyltransferase complex protein AlgI
VLFNSLGFLLFFLPAAVAGFFWFGRFNQRLAAAWLAGASIFFYGYWDYRYLALLGGSILFNYWAGYKIGHIVQSGRKFWLTFAVTLNLLLLAYYKYADFFIVTLNGTVGTGLPLLNIALPVGISFFTFTQIAFLVDTYQGKVKEYRFIHYVLFVTYFPHLIAGPVLHHKEMMPQFANPLNYRPSASNFAVGASIFVVGLAKKVLIADNIAPMANAVFTPGANPQFIEAWVGVLAYTFQLYFDFSGYSDMAIGLSRMFGIALPLNFNSPYKALNISDFWRRWHMTLSRFLRDYLYVALGGNRHGSFARYRNLMLTMVLGGLWHGAGWTYVVWGTLHGLYLVIHLAWGALLGRLGWVNWQSSSAYRWGATLLTFMAVMLAWVFFRATDFATAANILGALVGNNGLSLPNTAKPLAQGFASVGIQPVFEGIRWVDTFGLVILAGAMLLTWLAPNTQEIFRRFEPCLEKVNEPREMPSLVWQPSLRWSVALAFLMCICVLSLNRPSEFLYFQF